MRKASYFVCAVISSFVLVTSGKTGTTPLPKAKAPITTPRVQAVASISLPRGHRVYFFAPPNGPIAIAEIAHKGTPRAIDEYTLTHKKPSEIYVKLKGAGAVPPTALVEAEKRLRTLPAKARRLPPQGKGEGAKGPDDTADQQWFHDNFCHPFWECLQYYFWANTSSGHNQGRGYETAGMNGSEAQAPRTLEADWWDGYNWSTLATVSMPPGYWGWIGGGNIGAPDCLSDNPDFNWYFKSEILDNGMNDNATVSLSDHMYSPGGGGHIDCYNVPPCPCDCGCRCPAGRGGANYTTCSSIPRCENDSCVNPP